MNVERDQTWAAMYEVAKRMTAKYGDESGLTVHAVRRRTLLRVVEGLWVGDNGTDVFEPVRTRRPFSHAWTELQPVKAAAARIGDFIRLRPDLL